LYFLRFPGIDFCGRANTIKAKRPVKTRSSISKPSIHFIFSIRADSCTKISRMASHSASGNAESRQAWSSRPLRRHSRRNPPIPEICQPGRSASERNSGRNLTSKQTGAKGVTRERYSWRLIIVRRRTLNITIGWVLCEHGATYRGLPWEPVRTYPSGTGRPVPVQVQRPGTTPVSHWIRRAIWSTSCSVRIPRLKGAGHHPILLA
jgi:hypothetical protein